ncbi:hypothetical protein CXG81DRAFT_28796 [Caulochytrium protostelioides]|uniref:DNA replication licensing factor MCM7 n=1 Tax=Caulochytrium protostelioides TaxID=1555241 RepID=A0A4P9WX17_9FUNG|nr:MCM-domain-containing protein [Caulochytrium protostelioides]RKO98367.1 hypothetical protein CXG81DRAFT_28796 [Caulochytrium protostelioides]|eukprot:RKO98367.1 hypothetical protein CXG81DRAFT_28796 [Caulochytrium protostelioides]
MSLLTTTKLGISFADEQHKIHRFISKFQDAGRPNTQGAPDAAPDAAPMSKYHAIIARIAVRETDTITIELDDLAAFDEFDHQFVAHVERNTKTYVGLFSRVVDEVLSTMDRGEVTTESTPLEIIVSQRMQRDTQIQQEHPEVAATPPELTRLYSLFFKPRTATKALSIREIKSEGLGSLVKIRGLVTRVSNVKPQAVVICQSCEQCGEEIFQEITSQQVSMLVQCPSTKCQTNQTKGQLYLQTRASKFLRVQEVKIQELTDQVPIGHIPRTMTVQLYEGLVRQVSPGDAVHISGIYLPIPFTGFKAIRAGLLTDTYLEAHDILPLKKSYREMELTDAVRAEIEAIRAAPNAYARLAQSLAPEIYGHVDVKKALLLQLVAGLTKETKDGMKIRGDLNICLMGDPGVAKSQLLKYISKAAPRGVYTTGRGSSGVGLTASVARDPVTEELVLEAGALVLADNGIACIDEFDKMDEGDRTAIHEVMEQQTISISKAGITTTLNARTAILAAANPQFGRYDVHRRASDNINLPTALLSRFDLLFLLLDRPSIEDDLRLAHHITYVHQHRVQPQLMDSAASGAGHDAPVPFSPVPLDVLRHYVAQARLFSPQVPPDVADYIVNAYVQMRAHAASAAGASSNDFAYLSARTLLSIVRLATALARLRFDAAVGLGDVDEAIRLCDASKASITHTGKASAAASTAARGDSTTVVLDLVKAMSRAADGSLKREISVARVAERTVARGLSREQLDQALAFWADQGIWMIINNGSCLRWQHVDDDDDEA